MAAGDLGDERALAVLIADDHEAVAGESHGLCSRNLRRRGTRSGRRIASIGATRNALQISSPTSATRARPRQRGQRVAPSKRSEADRDQPEQRRDRQCHVAAREDQVRIQQMEERRRNDERGEAGYPRRPGLPVSSRAT